MLAESLVLLTYASRRGWFQPNSIMPNTSLTNKKATNSGKALPLVQAKILQQQRGRLTCQQASSPRCTNPKYPFSIAGQGIGCSLLPSCVDLLKETLLIWTQYQQQNKPHATSVGSSRSGDPWEKLSEGGDPWEKPGHCNKLCPPGQKAKENTACSCHTLLRGFNNTKLHTCPPGS